MAASPADTGPLPPPSAPAPGAGSTMNHKLSSPSSSPVLGGHLPTEPRFRPSMPRSPSLDPRSVGAVPSKEFETGEALRTPPAPDRSPFSVRVGASPRMPTRRTPPSTVPGAVAAPSAAGGAVFAPLASPVASGGAGAPTMTALAPPGAAASTVTSAAGVPVVDRERTKKGTKVGSTLLGLVSGGGKSGAPQPVITVSPPISLVKPEPTAAFITYCGRRMTAEEYGRVTYDEVAEGKAAAAAAAAAEAKAMQDVGSYVPRLAKVVFDGFHVTPEALTGAMCAQHRRLHRLRALVAETEKRLAVAKARHAAGLPPLAVPGLSLPTTPPAGFATATGSSSGGLDDRMDTRTASVETATTSLSLAHGEPPIGGSGSGLRLPQLTSYRRSGMMMSVEGKGDDRHMPLPLGTPTRLHGPAVARTPHLAPMAADASITTLAGWTVANDDEALAEIDAATVPAMAVGVKLRSGDEAYRVTARGVSHLPAFLGLVLFQRMVEGAAVADCEVALLMGAYREAKAELAAYTAGFVPRSLDADDATSRTVSTGDYLPASLTPHLSVGGGGGGGVPPPSAVAKPVSNGKGGATSGGGGGGGLRLLGSLFRRASHNGSSGGGKASAPGDGNGAHSASLGAGKSCEESDDEVGGGESGAMDTSPMPAPLMTPDTMARHPVYARVYAPCNPTEAYLRRAFERIREDVRQRCMGATVSVLDFVRVWHPSLDDKPRSEKLLPLLTPSPEPVLMMAWLEYKQAARRRVYALREKGPSAPFSPTFPTHTLAPGGGDTSGRTATGLASLSASGVGTGPSGSMAPPRRAATVGTGTTMPARAEARHLHATTTTQMSMQMVETPNGGDTPTSGAVVTAMDATLSGAATASPGAKVSPLTIARVSLLELSCHLRDRGITSSPPMPCLVPGHGLKRSHRVQAEDLAPAIESLTDRHPDLAHLKTKPMTRRRYITCALASILSSLPGGHHITGVPVMEVVRSNLADSFYLCSTSSTVGIVPFSNTYFDEVHGDFDAASELTQHNDELGATLPVVGGALPAATTVAVRSGKKVGASSLFPLSRSTTPTPDGGGRGGGGSGMGARAHSASLARLGGGPTTPPRPHNSAKTVRVAGPRDGITPEAVFGLPDPHPEEDDAHTVTMESLLSQCDVLISTAILERVFAGRARPLMSGMRGRLSFEDFVWFYCYQSERMTFTSMEYWMRCLDLDDDGKLSSLDLECAYEAKLWQLHELGGRHTTATKDVMAQLMDLVEPMDATHITKLDMKRTNCSRLVFDILISLKPCAAARNYL